MRQSRTRTSGSAVDESCFERGGAIMEGAHDVRWLERAPDDLTASSGVSSTIQTGSARPSCHRTCPTVVEQEAIAQVAWVFPHSREVRREDAFDAAPRALPPSVAACPKCWSSTTAG